MSPCQENQGCPHRDETRLHAWESNARKAADKRGEEGTRSAGAKHFPNIRELALRGTRCIQTRETTHQDGRRDLTHGKSGLIKILSTMSIKPLGA